MIGDERERDSAVQRSYGTERAHTLTSSLLHRAVSSASSRDRMASSSSSAWVGSFSSMTLNLASHADSTRHDKESLRECRAFACGLLLGCEGRDQPSLHRLVVLYEVSELVGQGNHLEQATSCFSRPLRARSGLRQ